MKQFMYKIA